VFDVLTSSAAFGSRNMPMFVFLLEVNQRHLHSMQKIRTLLPHHMSKHPTPPQTLSLSLALQSSISGKQKKGLIPQTPHLLRVFVLYLCLCACLESVPASRTQHPPTHTHTHTHPPQTPHVRYCGETNLHKDEWRKGTRDPKDFGRNDCDWN
jgi:hypothetical protein